VCRHAAPEGSEVVMEGLDYLSTIRRAVQKNPGEDLPPWFTEASTAIAEHEPQRCPAAACTQLRDGGRKSRSSPTEEEPTLPTEEEPTLENPLSGAPPEVP